MNEKIITAVGILFDMDKFVMDVYDNESWLTYGVPDGEFEEDTRADAEANYAEHDWLITDENEFICEDFQDFIDAFKGATRNSRDYDRAQRDAIVKEAEDFLAGNCVQKVSTTDNVNENKHLSNEQLRQYAENRKKSMNESLLLEASAKSIVKDAKDMKKSGHLYFIKKGDKSHKKCTFDEFKNWTDEELLNATVVDKQGYYVRRGAVKANGHERRQGPGTDFLSDAKGDKKNAKANAQLDKTANKAAAKKTAAETKAAERQAKADTKAIKKMGDYRKFTFIHKNKALDYASFEDMLDRAKDDAERERIKKNVKQIRDANGNDISWEQFEAARGAKQTAMNAKNQKQLQKQADAEQAERDKQKQKKQTAMKKSDAKTVRANQKAIAGDIQNKIVFTNDDGAEFNYKEWKKLKKKNPKMAMSTTATYNGKQYSVNQLQNKYPGLFESYEDEDVDTFSLNESYALAKSMDYDDDVEVGYDVEYDDDFNIDDTFG